MLEHLQTSAPRPDRTDHPLLLEGLSELAAARRGLGRSGRPSAGDGVLDQPPALECRDDRHILEGFTPFLNSLFALRANPFGNRAKLPERHALVGRHC